MCRTSPKSSDGTPRVGAVETGDLTSRISGHGCDQVTATGMFLGVTTRCEQTSAVLWDVFTRSCSRLTDNAYDPIGERRRAV
jgi:hypothetical protein